MISVILVAFIAVLTTLSAIISSRGPLYNTSKEGGYSLTENGKWVVIMGLAVIALSTAQVFYSEYKADKDRDKAEKTSHKRDSALRADYAASVERLKSSYDARTRELKVSYDTSTTNIVGALARYGLKYDSARQRIERIVKDSLRGMPPPVLGLSGQQIQLHRKAGDTVWLRATVGSADAGSKDFNIKFLAAGSYDLSGPFFALGSVGQMSPTLKLGTHGETTLYFGYYQPPIENRYILIFLYLTGTYRNIEGDKQYSIDDVYCYNIISGSTTFISGNTEAEIKKLFAGSL